MKKMILAALIIAAPFNCFSQELAKVPIVIKDKTGIIQSVEFPDSIKNYNIPTSSDAFFKNYLKTSVNDEFRKTPRIEKKKDFTHEHFDQYYKGIKVYDAGYNFHYKNGKMFYAQGHYVKVNDLEITPTVKSEKAKDCFAKYKGIPSDSVSHFISELIIKEIPFKGNDSVFFPKLVYRIYLYANYENNTEVAFVDAHTCEILLTEPALTGYSATGTFATRYSGTRQGITQNYSGAFHLADSTRGAIIHTWNLNNLTNILNRIELSDNDNNWTSVEHSTNENDMGLDVHWALQQIYDRLNNVHNINSYNNNGFGINAYVRYGTTSSQRDNASWSLVDSVLLFGDRVTIFRPVASVDAVGVGNQSAQPSVSGFNIVCTSGSTFTLQNPPSGSTVTWTHSNNLTYVSGQNTNYYTVSANASGFGWVNATLNTAGCEDVILEKTFWVGKPLNYDIAGPITIVQNSVEHYWIYDYAQIWSEGVSSFDWSLTSNLSFFRSHFNQTDTYIKGNTLGRGTISFLATNICGTSTTDLPVMVVESGYLMIFPNPASSEIEVRIVDSLLVEDNFAPSNTIESKSVESLTEFDLSVYNNYSIATYNTKVFGESVKINVTGWPKGIYHITMIGEDKKYTGSFIVE